MKQFQISYTLYGVRNVQKTTEPLTVVRILLFMISVVGVSFSSLTIKKICAL